MNKKTIITILLALLMAPLGLEAKKEAKTVEVPQLINYPSAELSEYRLHGGNVAIRGHLVLPEELKGQQVPKEILEMFNSGTKFRMRNQIVGKEKTSLVKFEPDGTISLDAYVPYPMFVYMPPLGTVYRRKGRENLKVMFKKGLSFRGVYGNTHSH